MRKFWSLIVVSGALAAAFVFAGSAKADDDKTKKEPVKVEAKAEDKSEAKGDDKKPPEVIVFDKAKMGTVKFQHKAHAEKLGGCDACHGGKDPVFPQKKTEGMKMADIYAGGGCGHCHDGKMKVGEGDKAVTVFAAKTGCMKCHKKDAPK